MKILEQTKNKHLEKKFCDIFRYLQVNSLINRNKHYFSKNNHPKTNKTPSIIPIFPNFKPGFFFPNDNKYSYWQKAGSQAGDGLKKKEKGSLTFDGFLMVHHQSYANSLIDYWNLS